MRMTKKGFTLVEVLVTAAIFCVVLGVAALATRVLSDSSSANANLAQLTISNQNALTTIINKLSNSQPYMINIRPDGLGGEKVIVKIPIADATPVANSIYTPDGSIKFGAAGRQNCRYEFAVNTNKQLTRTLRCEEEFNYCGDGCCGDGSHACAATAPPETVSCTPQQSAAGLCVSCVTDCGTCGDGTCALSAGETSTVCSVDCYCGNTTCDSGESSYNCSTDCGAPPPSGGGGGCLLTGTLITMADGSKKLIEEIKKGDQILSYDAKNKIFKQGRIKKVLRHTSEDGYLLINGHLKITSNHPVISDDYLVQVGFLKVGNRLLNDQGKYEDIKTIEKIEGKNKTYNFEVAHHPYYIADGYVVHNAYILPKELPGGVF